MSKFVKLFLLTLLLVGCSQEQQPKPTTPLTITTSAGEVKFAVEVATTPQELQIGLMNRKTLAFNGGMIFNIYPVRPTAMWMKNTKIPLDMLFIASDGTISLIIENTTPMSEEMLISRDPVRAVLELNAGQVKRHGIKVGDKISHLLFSGMLDTSIDAVAVPAPAAPAADVAVPELTPEFAEVPALDTPVVPEAFEVPVVPEIAEVATTTEEVEAIVETPAAEALAPPAPATNTPAKFVLTPEAPEPEQPKLPVPAPAM